MLLLLCAATCCLLLHLFAFAFASLWLFRLGECVCSQPSPPSPSPSTASLHSPNSQGGAISVTCSMGTFTAADMQLLGNYARQSGGGLQAGPSVACSLVGSLLEGNAAAEVGGGLTCDACEGMTLSDTTFTGNTAALGGGAALLDPGAAVEMQGVQFLRNQATAAAVAAVGAPAPLAPPPPPPPAPRAAVKCSAKRRALLQQPPQPQTAAASAVGVEKSAGPAAVAATGQAAVAATAPSEGSRPTTSELELGGGLFAEMLRAPLIVTRSRFTGNVAQSAGAWGLRARGVRVARQGGVGRGHGGGDTNVGGLGTPTTSTGLLTTPLHPNHANHQTGGLAGHTDACILLGSCLSLDSATMSNITLNR